MNFSSELKPELSDPWRRLPVVDLIGAGEVWKARDTRLGGIMAIKKVKEQH